MAKRPQVTLEDLKKSLNTLSSEMSEAQLKRANETLHKIEQAVNRENIESAVQEKTLIDVKKSLGKDGDINKNLKEMLKYYKTSNDKLIKKLDELKQVGGVNKVGDIRNEKPMTAKEGLKATVATVKGAASSIGRGARALGSGILETLGNPIGAAKKAGKVISAKANNYIKDIVEDYSTPEEYTIEGGRFQEQYSKSKQVQREAQGGSLMNPATAKKLDAHVGLKNYNDMGNLESKMSDVESRINDAKTQGFQPSKKDIEELNKLKEQHSSIDLRNQVKPAEKANQSAEASAITDAKALQKENPEADNIKSAQESMADDSKADLEISKQLLETTKESLQELKSIKEALSGGVEPLRTKPVEGTVASAGAQVAANESQLGVADIASAAGDLMGGKGKPPAGPSGGTINTGGGKGGKIPGKPSLGGRILGGLGKAARVLGPAAAIAGTAYSGFQGYQNAASNFDLQPGQEATTGQKISSTLGGVASGLTFGLADEKSVAQGIHGIGSAISDFFTGGDKDVKTGTGASGFPLAGNSTETSESYMKIGGERYYPDQELSPTQMAAITMGTMSGNSYPPDVMKKFNEQKKKEPKPTGDLMGSRGDGSNAHEFAKGGSVKGGGAEDGADYIVGEEGPELFVPFKDGVVIPNDISKKIAPAAIKGGLKGLAEGGIAFNDDGSYTKGNRTYSPSINGFQRSVSNTGSETTTGNVGDVSITKEKDIYGNERGVSAQVPLTSDLTLESGKLQAGSTIQYAKATGRDVSGKSFNVPLSQISQENESLKDEMSAKGGSSQPIIMNNSSNNATTQVVPMKGDPRPNSRGSALDRYLDKTAAY